MQRNPVYIQPLSELLNPILYAFFKEERDRLTKRLETLIIENQKLGGTQNAYMHGGFLYSTLPFRYFRGIQVKPVHSSLEPDADTLAELMNKLKEDEQKVRQGLSVIIPKCKHKQEFRDALPETLVSLVPELRGMERIEEEGHILREKPMLRYQYQRIVDLVDYYQANKLIY